jgi:hypothetical protein
LQWSIQPSTLFRAMPSTSIALSFVTVVDLKAPSHLFAPCYMTHRDPSVSLFLVCTSPQVPYSLSHASRGVFFLSFSRPSRCSHNGVLRAVGAGELDDLHLEHGQDDHMQVYRLRAGPHRSPLHWSNSYN